MLLSPQGAIMVIYCTYDKNNSTLVSKHRYVVAQNNNLSDRINIKCVGMIDPAAYGYYIDFVCMTHGGAAKAAYSSPALEYGEDGLNFDIPNCLTKYEGYVDAQLVIYEKSRESVVAKSVGRTGGIFEVAASVNSLETRVIEPANMLTELSAAVLTANNLNTEVAKTVEEARVVKADIENTLTDLDLNFTAEVTEKMKEVMKTLPVVTVRFYFYDRLVESRTLVQGSKVPSPAFSDFPSDCVCDGWYSVKLGRRWDFDADKVASEDVALYADCHPAQYASVSSDGTMTIEGRRAYNIYLPFEMQGVKVNRIYQLEACQGGSVVYVNDADYKFVNPLNIYYVVSADNSRYIGGRDLKTYDGIIKAPQWDNDNSVKINYVFNGSDDFEFKNCYDVIKTVLSGNIMGEMSSVAAGADMVLAVEIRGTVTMECRLGSFRNLQAVIFNSEMPEHCNPVKFTSEIEDCAVYAPDHLIQLYQNNGMWDNCGYELKPLSQFKGFDYDKIKYPEGI